MNHVYSGLILLNKMANKTSFSSLSSIKKRLNTSKVGHTGTLDKFAEGLLIVLVGKMTKLTSFFTHFSKTYVTTIQFGIETDTLDPEGRIVAESRVPSQSALANALSVFEGPSLQIPPLYSAVHVKGERAYRLAREGKNVELTARPIVIHSLSLLSYEPPFLKLRVECSKGTYIRSLARDIAHHCNAVGFVYELRRERIGAFTLENSVTEEKFDPQKDILGPYECFQSIPQIEVVVTTDKVFDKIRYGKPINAEDVPECSLEYGLVALFNKKGQFGSLMEKNGPHFTYKFVGLS